ncbi:MAG: cysteine desulfurase [Kordiimonadaceae bacterium]|nr:cysteine desulfurase [Kordiimonadaceae bacterium]
MTAQLGEPDPVEQRPIYLDYQATTPLDERVLTAMLPYLRENFGNPHSSTHAYGWQAEAALDIAREQVSALIGAAPGEVYFTSGATESNNTIIKGVMDVWGKVRPRLVTVCTEHKCVLESALYCQRQGYELVVLPVLADGIVDLDQVAEAVDERTALVSVMAVNNEIGVIQPLKEIGKIAKENGALFHSDIAQAFGKTPVDVNNLQLDLASISGHKIYGPKGIGAFYKRAGRATALSPLFSGGDQEAGLRSGTQAPALVAGLGMAAEIALAEMTADTEKSVGLSMRFKQRLFAALPGIQLNGHAEKRIASNLNLCFPGIDGELLLANIRSLALSSGAACASALTGPSYVLAALGLTETQAKSALRIGIGRFSTEVEIDQAVDVLVEAVTKLGGLRP